MTSLLSMLWDHYDVITHVLPLSSGVSNVKFPGHPSVVRFRFSRTSGFVMYAPILIHMGKANPKRPPTHAP